MAQPPFLEFVIRKLENFKNLSIGEQIAYLAIGLGLVLVLTSVILFLV